MAIAELRLFGGFELRRAGGEVIDLPGQKDRALIAILALRFGASLSRVKLASLLWSERGDKQARDSLKHSLNRLRPSFCSATSPMIVADRHSVALDPTAVTVDVAVFEQLVSDGTPEALERAVALYQGDLLDGFAIQDPGFEDWLVGERQRLRNSVEEALTKLMEQSTAAGAKDRAAKAARRLLLLDPLREAACRTLMQVEAEHGQTSQALKIYETLRLKLHRELGVKPEPATTELCDAIRLRRAGATLLAIDSLPTESAARAESVLAELPLPSKPSIAVLPFQNLSGDPEQGYFADGMVEEIITALSRMRWLFVIARNSSFTYRDRAVDVKQIGRELGVSYLLEGSVRKAGNRVRITGQLVDAATSVHLWADRFEGGLEDIFDLQDQVTASVVGAIAPKLEQAEIERTKHKPTESLDAYDYFLRGMSAVHLWTREANDEALTYFQRAIELDPGYAAAYGMAARCYAWRKGSGWVTDRAHEVAEAARLAAKAAELGKDDPVALGMAGYALAYVVGDIDDGAALIDRALLLDPNLASAWLSSGWIRVWLGDQKVAVEHLGRAMRLSPHDPHVFNMQAATALAHFFATRYAEALTWAEAAARVQPNHLIAACICAASSALIGRPADAQKAIGRLRRLEPSLCISNLRDLAPLRRSEDLVRLAEGLRKAGLSE